MGALCAVLFAGQWAYGANGFGLALAFTFAIAALLAVVLAGAPWARRALAEAPPRQVLLLALPALGVFVLGLLSLAPVFPVYPELWSAAGGRPVGTLDQSATVLELLKLAGVFCAFTLAAAVASEGGRLVNRFMQLTMFGYAAYALWALIAHQNDPTGLYGLEREVPTDRLTGAFDSPNSAALFFGMGLLLALAGLLRQLRRLPSRDRAGREPVGLGIGATATAAALCASCVVLTQSRTGIGVVVAGMFLLAAWELYSSRRMVGRPVSLLVSMAGVIAVAGLLALFLHHDRGLQRFATTQGDWDVRLRIFAEHGRSAAGSLWTGYGAGAFDRLNVLHLTSENYATLWDLRAVHNLYLHQVLSFGLVGAALLSVPVAAALVWAVRGAAASAPGAGWLRGVVGCSFLVLLHGFTDFGLEVPSIALFWGALLGLAVGLVWSRERRPAARGRGAGAANLQAPA